MTAIAKVVVLSMEGSHSSGRFSELTLRGGGLFLLGGSPEMKEAAN
jgi:hypothetical protein